MLGKVAPGIINVTDDHGKSPLHIAACNGFLSVCEKLVGMGADVGTKDDNGMTPLDYATTKGHSKVLKLLIGNHAPLESTNKNSQTALHHAASNGHVECVTILLDSGANITATDINGNNCLQVASENNNVDVCLALVKHKRWRDVLKGTDKQNAPAMANLIEFLPEVAEAVLDNCMETSKHSKEHHDYSVTYDFEYLDILSTVKGECRSYFAPHYMAKHDRESLLSHPVTIQLVDHKWNVVGKQLYFITLLVYVVYLSSLTALVVRESSNIVDDHCSKSAVAISGVCLGLSVFLSIKEILQVITLHLEYFFIPENYVEIPLCISSLIFSLAFLLEHSRCETADTLSKVKWEAGVICILLAWSNLLLYLKRIPFFGLVVVMFVQVLRKLVSVLLVSSIVLIGFALAFHILLVQLDQFSSFGYSFMKVLAMMAGELEYDDVFVENYKDMPYKELTITLFILFLLTIHIVMMNLMIGLAVGEITKMEKLAKLTMLKNEVELIKDLTNRYPKCYLKRIHQTKITVYPNRRNVWQRFVTWLGAFNYNSLASEEPRDEGEDQNQMYRNMEIEFEKQRKRIKKLQKVNEEQNELIRKFLYKGVFAQFETEKITAKPGIDLI